MPESPTVRKARRLAAKYHWRLQKSRERYEHCNNKGGYQLIDEYNTVVDGLDYTIPAEETLHAVELYAEKRG